MFMRSAAVLALAGALQSVTAAPADQESPKCASSDPFDRLDKNRDGVITREELPPGIRRNFDRVDANGDGKISRREDLRFRSRRRLKPGLASKPARSGQRFAGLIERRNLDYAGTENPRQQLDLLLPPRSKNGKQKRLPVVAFIHGGAWRAGDKRGGLARVAPFVRSGGYAGVSIGYRLSLEAQWPAQIHDCKAAIRWLRANADKYGLDADRIAVWGTSAGGHLVAMLGTSADVPSLEGTVGPHATISSRVRCVIDFFGPTEFLSMNSFPSRIDHDAADSPESQLVGGPIHERKDAVRSASPIAHVSARDAPTLLVHGSADALVPFDQSVQLDRALRQAGVESRFIRIEGGGHGGFDGTELARRVHLFLARHLLNSEVDIPVAPLRPQEEASTDASPKRSRRL